MARIDLPDPESSPELRKYYESSRYENESPYRRARLHNPDVLEAQNDYQRSLFEAGPVDEALYEYIMVTVAQTNDCDYCAGSHRLKLMSIAGVSEDVIERGDHLTFIGRTEAVRQAIDYCTA
jgi:AhpD family alkylhydroperoxidase